MENPTVKVRNLRPKFEIFLFGLGLGYIMVCDVTLVSIEYVALGRHVSFTNDVHLATSYYVTSISC